VGEGEKKAWEPNGQGQGEGAKEKRLDSFGAKGLIPTVSPPQSNHQKKGGVFCSHGQRLLFKRGGTNSQKGAERGGNKGARKNREETVRAELFWGGNYYSET